jgi:hypothetical protein
MYVICTNTGCILRCTQTPGVTTMRLAHVSCTVQQVACTNNVQAVDMRTNWHTVVGGTGNKTLFYFYDAWSIPKFRPKMRLSARPAGHPSLYSRYIISKRQIFLHWLRSLGTMTHAFSSTAAYCRHDNVAFHSSYWRHSRSPRCQHLDTISLTHLSQYFSSPTLWNRRQSSHSTHPLCNVGESKEQLS